MANKLFKLPNNLIRGDTPLLRFTVTDGTNTYNLTGWTATFTITTSLTPASTDTPVIRVQISGTSTGILDFQLLNGQSQNDTSQLIPGTTYYFDVQLNNGQSGTATRIFTPIRGTLGVDTDYTVN